MESVLGLITSYGVAVLFAATYLSCLALPVPSSLMMLAAGGFVAAGDLEAVWVIASAFLGAVAGDVTGYWIARGAGAGLSRWIAARPSRQSLFDRAGKMTDRWGGPGIYLSRWLFSPLGPYVNLAAGMTRFGPTRFLLWDIAGEATWVMLYVGLGYVFAESVVAVAEIAANTSGLMAAAAVTLGLGMLLWRITGKSDG